MENYKNLNFSAEQINQKLAWVGDKSKLATTLQETPVNQFMFTKDQKFINYYKRYKWIALDGTFVTTHKCIIDKLTAGTYEYRIRRDNSNYSSKIYIFKVLGDSEVTTFSYIQTSDQQGFNWQEYQAWKKSSYMISKEQNIEFTINTGDITQNGNREWFIKDLKSWKQTEEFPTGCEKCIVYTHDAPFSIVTYDFMNTNTTARAGSKLNTINNNGTYRFSRLFKKMGIRLVMAGHKHTYGISKPIYDAPIEYLEGNKASSAVDILSGEITTDMSRKPVIQVLRQDQVQVNNFARYEVVENITAPTYVTCQATGYKLISNKEQPSGDAYRIPWLLAYFLAATSSSNPKENTAQHKPMYIKYDVSDTNIKITAVQINGIWEVDSSSTKYDFNNQIENLTIDKMTLSTSTEEDLAIYSPDNQNFYTLKLQ